MARLHNRRCKLIVAVPVGTAGNFSDTERELIQIGTDEGEIEFRVRFKITKTDKKEPNTSEITVVNLNNDTRGKLEQKNLKAELLAGYPQALGRIFIGDVRICDHQREGADWNSVMHLGDGERSFRFARHSESFAPGTAAADILKKLAAASGLKLGNVKKQVASINRVYDQGYAVVGSVQRSIGKLLTGIGSRWSIQDGELQILGPDDSLAPDSIPEISPDSGLIGSPEMGTPEKKGQPALLKFKSLLVASARPGRRVRISSKRYKGEVIPKKVVLTGDTHGDEWYTEWEGVLLK